MNKPFVSVIIPVYNVEPYLRRCLDSIVNQTLKEIEIICVNDASPDNSAKILEEYAQKDSRIKIITFEQNRGVAVVRNVAMEQAKGEYIGFVDSDDYIDLEFFEKLYDHAKKTDAEVVKAQLNQINPDGSTKKNNIDVKLSNKIVFTGLFVSAIYKKTLIEKYKIKFLEGLIFNEDRLFPIAASFLANKVETVYNTFYNYIRRENSADCYLLNRKKLNDFFCSTKHLFEFFNENIHIESDYIVLVRVPFMGAVGLLARVEQKEDIELVLKEILELTKFVKKTYMKFVLEDVEIKAVIKYLENHPIKDITEDVNTIRRAALLEYIRKNIKNIKNR